MKLAPRQTAPLTLLLMAACAPASQTGRTATAKLGPGGLPGGKGAAPNIQVDRVASCALDSQKLYLSQSGLPDATVGGVDVGAPATGKVTGNPSAKLTAYFYLLSTGGNNYGYQHVKVYAAGTQTARLSWTFADAVDDQGDPDTFYNLLAESWLLDGGAVVQYSQVIYRVDKTSCQPKPTSVLAVTSQEGPSVAFTLASKNLLDGSSQPDSDSEPIAALQAYGKVLMNLDDDSLGDNGEVTYYDVSVWSDQSAQVTIKAGPAADGADPLTGTHVQMKTKTLTYYQDGKQADQTTCSLSPASTYRACTDDHYLTERVTQDLWLASDLVVGALSARTARAVNFAVDDLFASDLKYQVGTNVPLSFDNYPAYFTLSQGQAPDGRSNGYVVDDSQTVQSASLNNPIPNYAGNARAQPFLKETQFYDFSTPSVRQLAAQVASQAGAAPTQGSLVAALLAVVGKAVTYDTAALQSENIYQEPASQIIAAGHGVCQHFAAVFVALARANNIPARMIDGVGLFPDATNTKVYPGGHAWIEVMLDGTTWLPLDPQDSTDLVIVGRGYFPAEVGMDYETPVGQEIDPSAMTQYDNVLDGLELVKISSLPAPASLVDGPRPVVRGARRHGWTWRAGMRLPQ